MKRTDLARNKGKKIDGSMAGAATPGRYGRDSAALPDRREQRRRDQALGLVPFAVKLDGNLVRQLHARAEQHGISVNALVGELLQGALKERK